MFIRGPVHDHKLPALNIFFQRETVARFVASLFTFFCGGGTAEMFWTACVLHLSPITIEE